MKHQNVIEAFNILIAELKTALQNTRQDAATATQEGSYDEARSLLDEALKIEKFIGEIHAKQQEWTTLFGKSRNKKVTGTKRLPPGQRTPEIEFQLPILRALVALGGKAPMSAVLDRVYDEMKPNLKPVDFDKLNSEPETPRWRKTAQWAKLSLVRKGYLRGDSPRGIWEISEEGRNYLDENGG